MNKEIYINGMDWKRIKDNQGGLSLMITFKEYISDEDYIELLKRNYYFLTTKEEFEDLQENNRVLKEYYLKNVSKYEELIERYSNFQDRINKAIEYIENHIVATETEDILLKILQGEDNE